MKVTLIDYSGRGSKNPARQAAELMIFTKQTRLKMHPGLMDEIATWSDEKIKEELTYMANTIPSSWEFCNYTFLIEGVTRAFTHQLVRTRTASFAQQTMRILDVDGWDYATGPSIAENEDLAFKYNFSMAQTATAYNWLIDNGAAIEDARGILPTNILTNIVMGCNLRTLVETIRKRTSPRTQGEYREVIEAMKDATVEIHPWASLFFDRDFDKACHELDGEIMSIEDKDKRTKMLKLIDQIRNN